MKKEDFYKSLTSLYKKTGQGFPNVFRFKLDENMLKELEDEGRIKTVHSEFDQWICLTNVYCVEEQKNTSKALTFIRIFLGIDDLGLGIKKDDILKNAEYSKEYHNWYNENKVELSKIKNL